MALWDEVAARYSPQELIELTRSGQANSENSLDTTRAALAVTDVEALFGVLAQQAYDSTDARHVAIAVDGVMARLKALSKNASFSGGEKAWAAWKKSCEALAGVTSRARIQPKTSTNTTPSVRQSRAGEVLRPDFDSPAFEDLIADSPGASDDDWR